MSAKSESIGSIDCTACEGRVIGWLEGTSSSASTGEVDEGAGSSVTGTVRGERSVAGGEALTCVGGGADGGCDWGDAHGLLHGGSLVGGGGTAAEIVEGGKIAGRPADDESERAREERALIGSVTGPEPRGIRPAMENGSVSHGREGAPSLAGAPRINDKNAPSSSAAPRSDSGTIRAISAVSTAPLQPCAFGIHVSGRSIGAP